MTRPRPSLKAANDGGGRRELVPPQARRIIVSPDQIFPQRDATPGRRRSFEGVVMRYVLVSAVVVIAVAGFAMLATALLGR